MKKKFLNLILVLCLSLVMSKNVYALKIVEAGDNVIQEGTYDSTRLAAGYKVESTANIDGVSFVAGNVLTLEGSSTYGAFAGNTITVKERVEKDLFIAGNGISLTEEAFVGRDAYIAGNAIKISGTIERNLNVGGSAVNLSGAKIKGDAYVASEVVVLDENTVIDGKLTYNEDASISGLDKATVGTVKTKKMNKAEVVKPRFIDSIYAFVISLVAAYIVMLVLFYLIPKSKEKLDLLKFDGGTIFKTLLIGLGVLFLLPIVAIFALLTGFLTPLAFIAIMVYLVSVYLAELLSCYVVGNLLTTKMIKKDNVYLALAIGILLLKLLSLIPTLGSFVTLIALLYGLGLVFDFIKSRGK